MRNYFFYLVMLCFLISCGDDAPVNSKRGYDQEKLTEWNNSDRFNYDKVIDERSLNPILVFFSDLFSFVAQLFGSVIGYVILLILLVVIIYVVIRNSDLVLSKTGKNEDVIEIQPDDITEIDYDKLLDAAIKKKDYRLAIRYLFLKSLKHLQNSGLIEWHKEKTNYEYLSELPNSRRSDFRKLVNYFEYTWYGEFDTSEQLFEKVSVFSSEFMKNSGDKK